MTTTQYLKRNWQTKSDKQIAAVLGLTETTVRWKRRKLGLIKDDKLAGKLSGKARMK